MQGVILGLLLCCDRFSAVAEPSVLHPRTWLACALFTQSARQHDICPGHDGCVYICREVITLSGVILVCKLTDMVWYAWLGGMPCCAKLGTAIHQFGRLCNSPGAG